MSAEQVSKTPNDKKPTHEMEPGAQEQETFAAPNNSTRANILALQRLIGNQQVQKVLAQQQTDTLRRLPKTNGIPNLHLRRQQPADEESTEEIAEVQAQVDEKFAVPPPSEDGMNPPPPNTGDDERSSHSESAHETGAPLPPDMAAKSGADITIQRDNVPTAERDVDPRASVERVMQGELTEAAATGNVQVDYEPGRPALLKPRDVPQREVEAPEIPAPPRVAQVPTEPDTSNAPAAKEADVVAVRDRVLHSVVPGRDEKILPSVQPSSPDDGAAVPATSEAVQDAEVPALFSPDAAAIQEELPQEALTPEQLVEEALSERTTESAVAEAQMLFSELSATAESEKTNFLAVVEAQKAQIEAHVQAQISEVQAQVSAQTDQLQSHYAGLRATLQAHATQQKEQVTAQFEAMSAQVEADRTAKIAAMEQQLTERRQRVSDHKMAQKDQLQQIVESEANRADSELDSAANRALAIGEAEASRHPGSDDGAPKKRKAARDVARKSADDILAKKGGIRSKLQEKAAEFGGRYDQYADAANQAISDAAPDITSKFNEVAEGTLAELNTQAAAAQQGINARTESELQTLAQAEQQAQQRIQQSGQQVTQELMQSGQQATAQLEQSGQQLVGYIDNAVMQVQTIIESGEDLYVPGIQDLVISAQVGIQSMTMTSRSEVQSNATEVMESLSEQAANFTQQLAELVASLRTNADAALQSATAAIDGTVQTALQGGQQAVTQAQSNFQAVLDDAMRQVDDAVNRARDEMTAVTRSFQEEARAATDESLTEAKKPLTDPLEARVAEAADSTGTSILAGLFDALVEIVIGLVIMVAIALVVAAIFGLTLGGALLIVGAVFLVIAFTAAIITRSQQDPNAGVGTLILVSLADATGITGIYEGVMNQDIMTGQPLDLSVRERTKRGTVGFVQLIGTVLMVVGGVRTARVGRPAFINPQGRFLALRSNFKAAWGELVRAGLAVRAFGRRLYQRLFERRSGPSEAPPAPVEEQPSRPTEPPREEPVQPRRPYDPSSLSEEQLRLDLDPTPRAGETAASAAARARAARAELQLRGALTIYERLPEEPPRINLYENDGAYPDAHTVGGSPAGQGRHSPAIQLEAPRNAAGQPVDTGVQTIEGRVLGHSPWRATERASARWLNDTVMHRAVNDYIRANWETIRSDLATTGQHSGSSAAGTRVGEGYLNVGTMNNPQSSPRMTTDRFNIVILLDQIEPVAGEFFRFYILTTYPVLRL